MLEVHSTDRHTKLNKQRLVAGLNLDSDESTRYALLVSIVTRRPREPEQYEEYTAARIELYLRQAKAGKKTTPEALGKINQFLNVLQRKDPRLFDYWTKPDEKTHMTPVMKLRREILPPPIRIIPLRIQRR